VYTEKANPHQARKVDIPYDNIQDAKFEDIEEK